MTLRSWPPLARHAVLDAARYYYREMLAPWPVPDVIMDGAIEQATRELEAREPELYAEASARWIDRWEKGELEAPMRREIEKIYRRLLRAEGSKYRSHVTKKTGAQLDREIASALQRSHASTKHRTGRGTITAAQAVELPRFEFLAHWLAVVTRKKANRGPLGKQVKRVGALWKIVYPNGLVEYETAEADRLIDYARRGELGPHIRDAEEFRILAHQRAG